MDVTYSHRVDVDKVARRLTIHRVYAGGRTELYTEMDLPARTIDDSEEAFRAFSCLLGENLLLDSPAARELLGL